MPNVQHASRQLHLKIVYYGPGLGGKTTNLEYIHRNTRRDRRGKLISLVTEAERTLFFDLLPMELGTFRDYTVHLHLCTVPGQIAQDHTRRMILRHVDGVVFVVDCQEDRVSDNLRSVQSLAENLRSLSIDPRRLPTVIQYNKRDLDGALPVAEIQQLLSIPDAAPAVEASALHGGGVLETLKQVTRACLRLVGDPREAPEGRTPSILPGQRPSMFPDAMPPAVRLPRTPRAPSFETD